MLDLSMGVPPKRLFTLAPSESWRRQGMKAEDARQCRLIFEGVLELSHSRQRSGR